MDISKYHQVINNTKWEEIRWAMVQYPKCIRWRTKNLENGYICPWDGEWFYHFRLGGYECIEWVELELKNENDKNDVLKILKKIYVPGEILSDSIKIYGYIKIGTFFDYL